MLNRVLPVSERVSLLCLCLVISACSGGSGDSAAVEAQARAQATAEDDAPGTSGDQAKYRYQRREAPSGEYDDADAKLVFNLRGCNACHEIENPRIGPPYRAMALRYAADHAQNPGAREQALAAKIRFGGAGAWGNVPMISNPSVSQAEAESIARWIMGLKQLPATPKE